MFELLISLVVILQFMVSLITLVSVRQLRSEIEKLDSKIECKKTASANVEAEEKFQAQTLLSCPMCGSKRLSGSGSNQFVAQRTCLDCKSIFKTDKAH